ncbi:LacI family DNA-binding transcriptional regulator [Pelagicoccus sp. SDUM812003]|uniref:LacI family DNA-binding transcriptional regulator n=1 Tax=Pelagicoccus sp. SDUM812003 TaxID=3041267 RepID=UPI00280F22BE|nr:LacI family DNA-binding transcriptional regulator [Pelagicoccus sp. SDUM812003]MDQ8205536.1 LacI family DNA-binding transcriptional regulator [Pelagicoccus sp. SDUM812003]
MKRITLADVAKEYGCHPTTVSMALRNHPRLPQKTIEKIQALAEKMGYRPDPALGALVAYRRNATASRKASPLAYVTHWNTRFGWKDVDAHRQFYEGASERAESLGYKLDHFWLGDPNLSIQRIGEILVNRGIRGVVIASHMPTIDNELDWDWTKFSAVKIDFFPSSLAVHTISNDQRSIMRLAMRKAIDAGYRKIGCIMPRWWDDYVNQAWSSGFLSGQLALREEERIPMLFFEKGPENNRRIDARHLKQWMDQWRPEVIVSHSLFVEQALRELDVRLPEDVAYIDVYPERKDGEIAGVVHNCHRVGEMAVEILAGQLQQNQFGLPAYPTSTMVEGTWVDGRSLPTKEPALSGD